MSIPRKVFTEGPYGIIEGEPNETYHANPALSKSKLDVFIESPLLYYKTYIAQNLLVKPKKIGPDGEEVEERWKVVGNALHARLLEGEAAYVDRYVVQPDFGDCRKKENKDARNAWLAANLGKKGLTEFESKQNDAMVVAARSNPGIKALLLRHKPEVTFRVNDGEIDLQCRADGFIESADAELAAIINRESQVPDLVQTGDAIVMDIKTVASFSGSDFQNWDKAVWQLGYHRAVAFYRGVMRSVRPFPRLHWIFVAIEKDEPFRAGLYVLNEDGIVRGWDEVVTHLRRFKQCVHMNVWPGLPAGVQVMSLPGWYLRREII